MNRVIRIAAAAAFFGASALIALAGGRSEPAATPTAAPTEVTGRQYLPYSPESYAAAASYTRVLFFHASWCPTCRAAEKALTSRTADLPERVVVLKTDYDKEAELKKLYGISTQHTFVLVDAEGKLVAKWTGGDVDQIAKRVAAAGRG